MDGNIGKYKFSVILKIKYFVHIMSWTLYIDYLILPL